MSRRRCCCDKACFLFEDDFERDNSTDLGSDWNEVVGDWGIQEITDDMLTTHKRMVEKYDTATGTAGAIVICTQAVPARSEGEMDVSIEVPVYGLTTGDTYYLYPACTDVNTVGTVVAKFVWNGTKWTTSIYVASVEIDSYETPSTGSPHEYVLHVCVDRELGGAKAWVSPTVNEYAAWAVPVDPGTGRYAGVGHNNTGHLNQFDNFHLEELRTEEEICQSCFCECDGTTPSLTLLGTISCATDRAHCFDGEYFNLDLYTDSRPQVLTWRGGLTFMGEVLEWQLVCTTTGDASGFALTWVQCGQPGHNCSTTAPGCLAGPWMANGGCGESTCDPLNLVFGPFLLSWLFECDICYSKMAPGCTPIEVDDCTGQFYIVITEVP